MWFQKVSQVVVCYLMFAADCFWSQHCFLTLTSAPLQVRVDTYNYIGMGNSTNKKDAQTNAARDFVNYLVRLGEMSAAEVPAVGVSTSVFTFL